jgi:protein O-GlcNAc transferase
VPTPPPRRLDPSEAFQSALSLHRQGRLAEAERLYRSVLAVAPAHFGALHHLGVVQAQQGKLDDAIRLLRRALSKNPNSVEVLSDLGVTFESAKRYSEAIPCYEKALALRPDYAGAAFNLGNALQATGRHQEAIARFETALALRPDHAEARNNLGQSLHALDRHAEAIAQFEAALAFKPGYGEAHNNLGVALNAAGRLAEAVSHFNEALAASPGFAEAHSNLGDVLCVLGRNEEAVAHCEQALNLKPGHTEAYNNLGNALSGLGRFQEAIASYRRAIDIDPLQGNAQSGHLMLKRRVCDWTTYGEDRDGLIKALGSGAKRVSPFALVASIDDPALHLQGARQQVRDWRLDRLNDLSGEVQRPHERLRLAYLSADFREHAVAHVTAELFELHDRRQFEVIAFSFGPNDGSDVRRRLERGFDRFRDVRGSSDLDIAREMKALEIDLAIDLMGFTRDCRPAILAHRPAPIQVNFLGYPGTMGADFIDYIIVDPYVVPPECHQDFAERLVELPDCYQPNDRKRSIDDLTPSRADCGLPERGFVFACFNNTYKITPPVFDVWMRLLRAIPDSVLWLLGDNEWATRNLRSEAAAREVDPGRLIFAERRPLPAHLVRHRLAGLFLDTLPYNAHVTASDALWAGLPVLTCSGRSFAARVAGSLLHAIGLPDLVTATLDEYEGLALRLARDPGLLGAIRERLAKNRLTTPLFDSDRFRRHLEHAYREMWACRQRGEPPRSFAVPSLSA